jgi:myo-inositol 2-dehydrogenase / D-chiro-inositol 1-dehydrogenase
MNRRKFLQGASTACSLMIVKPSVAFSYAANSAVQYGLLGCGKRGTSVATSFATNTQARVVALGDIFPDQLAIGKQHFDQLNSTLGVPAVDPKLTFHGWEAYKAMAANPHIDAVQISTPPFFHVEHMDILSAGGKHVYCEKPVGVDIPQTRRALQIAKRIDGKVSASVGFQIRSAPPFAEIVQRIHAGQIGKIASIAGYYNAPPATYPDRGAMPHDEQRLRNWLWDKTLSGDILLEQNIHVIDVCNWVMESHPLKATARASRKVIQNFGNINDNYEVIFEYPGEVELVFSSTQFNAPGYFDVKETFFGTEGIAEMPYKGALRIQGQKPWTWTGSEQESGAKFAADGAFSDNLADADKMKDRSFIESITGNKFQNQIAAGVDSARTCMMARKSAETGRTVTWQDIEADTEQYQLGIEIRKFV